MKLIYRGQTFDRIPALASVVRLPRDRGINWRYQIEGTNYVEVSRFSVSHACPIAINWRYQAIAER